MYNDCFFVYLCLCLVFDLLSHEVMLKEEVPALMLEDENRTLSLCSSSSGERCDNTRCDFRWEWAD